MTRRRSVLKAVLCLAFATLILGNTHLAAAEPLKVQGTWRTDPADTANPSALVSLWVEDGVLFGKVQETFDTKTFGAEPVCTACTGIKKDKPLKTMIVLWRFRQDSDQPLLWDGGRVMDPSSGKIYAARIKLAEDGESLEFTAYLGIPYFGRTMHWRRHS